MNSLTIISKNFGTQKIWLDSFDSNKASKSSTIFKVIEHIFNEWYVVASKFSKDVVNCYNGWGDDEPAVYSKVDAIRAGIDALIEYAVENNKSVLNTRQIQQLDIESAFEL